jgi:hypothetical protein
MTHTFKPVVILPEVFLKAIALVRNTGHTLENFTTVNMDFINITPQWLMLRNVQREKADRVLPGKAIVKSCCPLLLPGQ